LQEIIKPKNDAARMYVFASMVDCDLQEIIKPKNDAARMYVFASMVDCDLQEIIKPKNDAAGYARRIIFGFYMDHFFLGVPLARRLLKYAVSTS
jgi:hypothetical protein